MVPKLGISMQQYIKMMYTKPAALCLVQSAYELQSGRPDQTNSPTESHKSSDDSIDSVDWCSVAGLEADEILRNRSSCALCGMVYNVLQRSGQMSGDVRRRTYLYFVTKFGWPSKGTPWQMVDVDADPDPGFLRSLKQGAAVSMGSMDLCSGIAGLAVSIGSTQVPGETPTLCPYGMRVYTNGGGSAHAGSICPRRKPSASCNEHTFAMAKEWLKHCSAKHLLCHHTLSGTKVQDGPGETQLPLRVIRVVGPDPPRLVESRQHMGQFIALSYTWGPSLDDEDSTVLTARNFDEFKRRIPLDRMPQTMLDAMEATRQLGVEYLWVDSLCIIQKDNRDWEQQSALMPDVYQNAILTIVVLGERDRCTGFLARGSPGASVAIPWYEPGESGHPIQCGHIMATSALPFHKPPARRTAKTCEVQHSNWNSRAWTYQERALSRRILYFGEYQMYWECAICVRSEDGFDEKVAPATGKEMQVMSQVAAERGSGSIWRLFARLHDILEESREAADWKVPLSDQTLKDQMLEYYLKTSQSSLVGRSLDHLDGLLRRKFDLSSSSLGISGSGLLREYSSRSLSDPTDKLAALQGLAQALGQASQQEYFAGVWTKSLAMSLFWHSPEGNLVRPAVQRAPTWSWAAWDGLIEGYGTNPDFFDETIDLKQDEIQKSSGDLRDPLFLEQNHSMQKQRGVQPVSLQCDAAMCTVSRSPNTCLSYPRVYKQLVEDLGLWPRWYRPWSAESCHLLYFSFPDLVGTPRLGQRSVASFCPGCQAPVNCTDESVAVEHLERCPNAGPSAPADIGRRQKLVGMALFDEPTRAARKIYALVLWRKGDPGVAFLDPSTMSSYDYVRSLDCLGPADDTSSGPTHGSILPSPIALLPSTNHVLGFRRAGRIRLGRRAVLKQTWRSRRSYSLLLVQPTPVAGTYRRVGIAIAYSLPKLANLGGVDLDEMTMRKRVTLV
ncbi:Uu.00g045950.m01.CDS01 [Anthostomella pinea]|uniref:Uu.00g045950.m01.CDS01 n=1 Tax=Anthostomella pinea TaxID=933095 RepID=A0AAI8VBS3_9PEZI|nr:Uu.00g045950.m01.CDS01 [Anthostomella pinea]